MKKLVLFLGVLLVGGSAFLMNDFTKQQYKAGDQTLDMPTYMAALQPRAIAFAKDLGPKIASLPQVAKEKAVAVVTNDGRGNTVQPTNRLGALKQRNQPVSLTGGASSGQITGFGTRTGDTEEAAKNIGKMMEGAQAGKF